MVSIGVDRFEHDVMEMLLAGPDPILETLRVQFRDCSVARRESTGCGFFTTFIVAEGAPRIQGHSSFSFGDVGATIPGLEFGAGFVLHVNSGAIDYLEAYSYDEPWPKSVLNYSLAYLNQGKRDLGSIHPTSQ